MLTTSNRRDFLKRSALFGAGVMMLGRTPLFAAAPAGEGKVGTMTALALADDALHLAGASSHLAPALRESLAFGINVFEPLPGNAAFFGRLMPARQADIVDVLGKVRDHWSSRADDDHLELKLALASGWLIQRAGAAAIGPSLAETSDAMAARTYQDAAIVRARSKHLDGEATAEEVAALFREMGPRTLIRFHTLIPDYDDAEGWITRLVAWRRAHADMMDRYARAFIDTSSALHKRYVVDPNFYDPGDDILRLTDQVRRTEAPPEVDLSSAIEGRNNSRYGEGLAQGIAHLLSVSAFLEGLLDEKGFEKQLAEV